MTKEEFLALKKEMDKASESISNLKLFISALDNFLKKNGLGSAEYSPDYPAVTFRADEHGYDIAMIHVRDKYNNDVIYCYVYTDGTVTGENFSGDVGLHSRLDKGCTYLEAAREILQTVGAIGHHLDISQKIKEAIKALN